MQASWTTRSEPPAMRAVHLTMPRAAYHCGACGYGAVLPTPTGYSCPMCRSSAWLPDARARHANLARGSA